MRVQFIPFNRLLILCEYGEITVDELFEKIRFIKVNYADQIAALETFEVILLQEQLAKLWKQSEMHRLSEKAMDTKCSWIFCEIGDDGSQMERRASENDCCRHSFYYAHKEKPKFLEIPRTESGELDQVRWQRFGGRIRLMRYFPQSYNVYQRLIPILMCKGVIGGLVDNVIVPVVNRMNKVLAS